MNTQYNLSNLEANFKQYLLTVNTKPLNSITIKNYLSDLRHFWGWIQQEFRIQNLEFRIENVQNVKTETIKNYIEYQKLGGIPTKTVNRRLSTLRKFGSFCISQGWMKENVFKKISNVATNKGRLIGNEVATPAERARNDILDQYEQYLVKQNLDRQNIKNLIADVEEFYQLTQNL